MKLNYAMRNSNLNIGDYVEVIADDCYHNGMIGKITKKQSNTFIVYFEEEENNELNVYDFFPSDLVLSKYY